MAKREPYVIHENLTVQEIVDMIKRAYDEGFSDGKKESQVITCPNYGHGWTITTPLKEPNAVYCGVSNDKVTLNNETV